MSSNVNDRDSEDAPLLKAVVPAAEDDEDEGKVGCAAYGFCSPKSCVHRYFPVLILICFLSFGSYFVYDNPAALQDTMERDLDIDSTRYMVFYSIYSWPNVVLCMFGGYLIDRVFGLRLGAIIFSVFVTVGQIIFSLGALTNIYGLMIFGRFVFGIGGESLAVAQNTLSVKWFSGKELNMVFGLQLSFSRVGSTVNMNIMQPIYDAVSSGITGHPGYKTLGIALFIGGLLCVFSLICAFILSYFDKRADRILERGKTGDEEKIEFRDIKTFPATFWLISIVCVAYYVAVFPFISLGLVFFEMKFGYDSKNADAVNSVVYIVSAVASPLFGFLIDRAGKNLFWVLTGVIFTLGCHMMLAFTFINPYVAMVIMGLAYSVLASALWPMVSLIIPQYQLGTAYGIMQAVQNLGLASIALVAGAILDKSGYLILEVFFMACLCLALIASVLLYLMDAAKGGTLNFSSKKRHRIADELKEQLEREEKLPIES